MLLPRASAGASPLVDLRSFCPVIGSSCRSGMSEASLEHMDDISEELIEIRRDGIIDDEEKIRMESIIETLDTISQIISEIKQKINMQ